MSKRTTIGAGLIAIIIAAVAAYACVSLDQNQTAETQTAKIAAFNIQIFGKTKSDKPEVMVVLTNIVREFDIVLIQEIRDATEQTIPNFIQQINQANGVLYSYIESPRLGRTTSKEAYAYIYNTQAVQFVQGSDYVYDDNNDVFEREPYIATFKIGNFDFTLAGIHTKPEDAYNEIGNLTTVISSIQTAKPNEKDIIVMGDFNADGSYYNEDDTSNPLKAPQYNWIITNNIDTTVKTDNTYDRIIILDTTLNHEYDAGTAQAFHFDQAYGLNNQTFVEEISDHYPVFAQYKTNLQDDD
jgi:endonuclease/exonuclease/phosphatase family metal-dependent hydrolase